MADAHPARADWMGEEDALSSPPPCPFCDGTDTEVISPFGGQLSVSQCWCHRCRTGFDYLKWEEENRTP